jgi:hypothetical protein
MALLLPVSAAQVQSEDWAEAMAMLGFGDLVAPAQTLIPAMADQAWVLAATGIACVLAGVAAFLKGWRWPLQAVAVAHLVLLPLGTWWSHRLTATVLPLGWGEVLGEAVVLALSLAAVVASLRIIHRAGKPAVSAAGP